MLIGALAASRRHLEGDTPSLEFVVIGNLLPTGLICLIIWLETSHSETAPRDTRGAWLVLRTRGFLHKLMPLWLGYASAMYYSMAMLLGVFMTLLALDVSLSRLLIKMTANSIQH